MLRRPPRSTLFPTRRSSDLTLPAAAESFAVIRCAAERTLGRRHYDTQLMAGYALLRGRLRSEEHTSELQSQSNLVCRLLLEKKKNTNTTTYIIDSTSTISTT